MGFFRAIWLLKLNTFILFRMVWIPTWVPWWFWRVVTNSEALIRRFFLTDLVMIRSVRSSVFFNRPVLDLLMIELVSQYLFQVLWQVLLGSLSTLAISPNDFPSSWSMMTRCRMSLLHSFLHGSTLSSWGMFNKCIFICFYKKNNKIIKGFANINGRKRTVQWLFYSWKRSAHTLYTFYNNLLFLQKRFLHHLIANKKFYMYYY